VTKRLQLRSAPLPLF